jgi:hypothetical protein
MLQCHRWRPQLLRASCRRLVGICVLVHSLSLVEWRNDPAHLPGPLGDQRTWANRHAGRVRCSEWFGSLPSPDEIPRPFLLSPGPAHPEREVVGRRIGARGGKLALRGRPPIIRSHGLNKFVRQTDLMALNIMGKPLWPHPFAIGQVATSHLGRPRPAQPESAIGIPRVGRVSSPGTEVREDISPFAPSPTASDQPPRVRQLAACAPRIPVVIGAPVSYPSERSTYCHANASHQAESKSEVLGWESFVKTGDSDP